MPRRAMLHHLSGISLTADLYRPTHRHRTGRPLASAYLVFQLLRFTWLPVSPQAPVGSYPTLSPLPIAKLRAVYSLLHLLSPPVETPSR